MTVGCPTCWGMSDTCGDPEHWQTYMPEVCPACLNPWGDIRHVVFFESLNTPKLRCNWDEVQTMIGPRSS